MFVLKSLNLFLNCTIFLNSNVVWIKYCGYIGCGISAICIYPMVGIPKVQQDICFCMKAIVLIKLTKIWLRKWFKFSRNKSTFSSQGKYIETILDNVIAFSFNVPLFFGSMTGIMKAFCAFYFHTEINFLMKTMQKIVDKSEKLFSIFK